MSRQRLLDLVVFEYRSLVVRRLGVTAEWRVLEWTDSAACAGSTEATFQDCQRCSVAAECLAAAIASDDRTEWRGRLSRGQREELWMSMEQTYREVRDLEIMRLDVDRLINSQRPATRLHSVKGPTP